MRPWPRRAFLAVLLGPVVCCRPVSPPDPVILALGHETARHSEFAGHLARLEDRGGVPLGRELRAALLEPFLEERVLVLEARNRGLVGPRATAEQEEAAVRRLLAEEVMSRVAVDQEEVADYFARHAAEFRVPEAVTVRQILVPTSNEARDVRRRLHKDPRSFELLARTRSRGPEAAAGGLMGTFARGQLPQTLERAVFGLAAGATSDIVETPLGYHVLRVESRQPARDVDLAECRAQVQALLARHKADEGQRQFVRDLLSRAKVNHEAAYARSLRR